MQEGYSGCLGRGLHDFVKAQQHYEQRTLGAGIGEEDLLVAGVSVAAIAGHAKRFRL